MEVQMKNIKNDLKRIFRGHNGLLDYYYPKNWKRCPDFEKEEILEETKKIMLNALKIPKNNKCPIVPVVKSDDKILCKARRIRFCPVKKHMILVNKNMIYHGVPMENRANKSSERIIECMAVVAFSSIIHECIHVSQDYVKKDDMERYQKLKDNEPMKKLKIEYNGKKYTGSKYLSGNLPFLHDESQKIVRQFYQLQYREREAHKYTKAANDLLLEYLSANYPSFDQSNVRAYCREMSDLDLATNSLNEYFGCEDVVSLIDETLHALGTGGSPDHIPKNIVDTIKWLSALTFNDKYNIECDSIRKKA